MVETDYSSWAVFVQCEEEGAGNKFLSTRFVVIMMKMFITTTNTTMTWTMDMVFVQCEEEGAGNKFLSTRCMIIEILTRVTITMKTLTAKTTMTTTTS